MSARGAPAPPWALAYPLRGVVGPGREAPALTPTMALPWPYHSSEVRHIISNLGIDGLSEEELDEMIAEVDPNGSGVINYKDFVKRIFAPIPPVSEE